MEAVRDRNCGNSGMLLTVTGQRFMPRMAAMPSVNMLQKVLHTNCILAQVFEAQNFRQLLFVLRPRNDTTTLLCNVKEQENDETYS